MEHSNKWVAYLKILGTNHYVGSYSDRNEAMCDIKKVFDERPKIVEKASQIDEAVARKKFVNEFIREFVGRDQKKKILSSLKPRPPGVTWDERRKIWRAQTSIGGINYHIGHYTEKSQAINVAVLIKENKEKLMHEASPIANVTDRKKHMTSRIREIVGSETKTQYSQFLWVTWDKKSGKWRAHFTLANGFYHIGVYATEAEAAADADKLRPHMDVLRQELSDLGLVGERQKHWAIRKADILGYPVKIQASKYRGVVRSGKNGWMAIVRVGEGKYRLRTQKGPGAEELAKEDYEAIYPHRKALKEQLEGIACRHEKRFHVLEYWSELLGCSPPPRRMRTPRGRGGTGKVEERAVRLPKPLIPSQAAT